MPDHNFQEFEECLAMFGWVPGGEIEQFLANGESTEPERVFHHPDFNSTIVALNPQVDRKRGLHAGWGVYDEGSLDNFGDDVDELLACLSKLSLPHTR